MSLLSDAAHDFLAQKSIAVAGVSRSGDAPANYIYRRLRELGYVVYAVNPNVDTIEGDRCYRTLGEISGPVECLMIATHPNAARQLVIEASDRGVSRVWMHRSFGEGSVDESAVNECNARGIAVIPGSCPMMFCEAVDFPHKCIHFLTHLFGGEPDEPSLSHYFAHRAQISAIDAGTLS